MPPLFPLVPDHEVLAELGRGTLGTVYKVLSRRFRDVRALKLIAAPDAALAHRVRRQYRVLTGLDHPALVRPVEMFQVNDSLCLTAELVEGRDLASFLGPGAGRDPERMRQLIYLLGQALKLLGWLHERDLVHGGIKPTNLLVACEARLRVTDAGLSLPAIGDAASSGPNWLGNPAAWLAPEQILGRPVDLHTDLYGIGLCAWVALTGTSPHGEPTLAAELAARTRGEPPPLATGEARADRALGPLLARLLARSPDARPVSAAEVLHELKQAWERYAGLSAGEAAPAPPGPVAVAGDAAAAHTRPLPRPVVAPAAGSGDAAATSGARTRPLRRLAGPDPSEAAPAGPVAAGGPAAGDAGAEAGAAPPASRFDTGPITRPVPAAPSGSGVGSSTAEMHLSDLYGPEAHATPVADGTPAAAPAGGESDEERIARLGPAAAETLAIAALAGEELRLDVLSGASSRPEGERTRALGELMAAGLLAASPGAANRFSIPREPVRRAALAALDPPRAAALAGRIAPELERALGLDRVRRADDLARLWDQAGEAARAIEYLPQAAEQRERRGDSEGAVAAWTRLLELVGRQPGAARQRWVALDLEARKRIARAHLAAGEITRARGELDELVRRARTARRAPEEVEALALLAEACGKAGDSPRAGEAAAAALARARALGYTAGEAAAHECLGVIARRSSDLKAASQALREALRLRRSMNDAEGVARVQLQLGFVARNQDQLDKARKHFEEARAAARRLGDRPGEAAATAGLASVCLREERHEEARRLYEQARALDEALAAPRGLALADLGLGTVDIALGGFRLALERFERALAAFESLGDRPNAARALVLLGHTYERTGSHREAAKRYREALARAEASADPLAESEARAGLALALVAGGERAAALDSARAAVAAAERAEVPARLARARHVLAQVSASEPEARAALALAEAAGDQGLICLIHHQLATLSLERGDREAARQHFQKAFTIVDQLAERSGAGRDAFLKKPEIAAICRDARRL